MLIGKVEPIRNLFAALFLSSIGMLINVQFLLSHMDILLASVILVIITKTILVTLVVRVFGYSIKTSLLVSLVLVYGSHAKHTNKECICREPILCYKILFMALLCIYMYYFASFYIIFSLIYENQVIIYNHVPPRPDDTHNYLPVKA